jgi:hypothetical protein
LTSEVNATTRFCHSIARKRFLSKDNTGAMA